MICLGIESSCDETGLALLRDGKIAASLLASQAELHAIFGGVVPELASREHYRFMGPLFDALLQRAQIKVDEIDLVAVARGPGLLGCLLTGLAFAKGLALALGKPLLGVNHLHAHLLAVGMENDPVYPALGLLVSGGHTNICFVEGPAKISQLGRSIDDAAGECLDKTGSILGLPYPAGKRIDSLAAKGKADPALLPRPYLDNENLDFSFSGLKTAAIREAHSQGLDVHNGGGTVGLENFCASLNLAIVDTLLHKLEKALEGNRRAKAIWLAGGVAANGMLRLECGNFAQKHGLQFLAPNPALCTDNGAMIAHAAWLLHKEGYFHGLELEAVPRGRAMPDDLLKMRVP